MHGTLEEMLARVLSQLHGFHPRTCHAHFWHACWSKHFLDTLDCLHGSQTNPYCMRAPRSGNQTSCISDCETDTVHLHGSRGNSYCQKQIAGLGLRLITSAVFIIRDGDSNTIIAEQLIISRSIRSEWLEYEAHILRDLRVLFMHVTCMSL